MQQPAWLCRAMNIITNLVAISAWLQLADAVFTDLDYADDVALLVDDPDTLQQQVEATKFHLYSHCVLSVLLYGCETSYFTVYIIAMAKTSHPTALPTTHIEHRIVGFRVLQHEASGQSVYPTIAHQRGIRSCCKTSRLHSYQSYSSLGLYYP